MRGGAYPPALLFIALGLALSSAARVAWVLSFCAWIAGLVATALLPIPVSWLEEVFLGCWLSVVVTAASALIVRGITRSVALLLSFNAGIWASAIVSVAGSRLDLLKAMPCLLVLLPASWIARRYHSIPLKVVASWLIAVAVLAATLQLIPVTPGYLPDHLE